MTHAERLQNAPAILRSTEALVEGRKIHVTITTAWPDEAFKLADTPEGMALILQRIGCREEAKNLHLSGSSVAISQTRCVFTLWKKEPRSAKEIATFFDTQAAC